ncbi:delta-aminolevulinic acid dehydratase [Parahaliea mediterranea]|uniref:Delta-aminolevulinic acid dehydratase n=1 Tax=Parahaliea mediterranea TaxID=651086 RepID=A0A939IPF5_9GAMM|nr:delta-aminolevulinic acid dehydratase [Parahaliea mediterranea]MBN7799113.1 delta-aminolevulinic acid dehydratase [Parahaliea mediterranea]
MRRNLLFLALALLAARPAFADCECLWQGSFDEVQGSTDLVVSGTVVEAAGNSIDLEVKRELRGGREFDTIRVWLKTGDYCRPEPEVFPVGSQWVMALHEISETVPGGFNPNTPNYSYGRVGDYWLSNCGGYWLSREDDWVTGNLVNAPRWVREPQMTPVMLELVADYVRGEASREALLRASQEDPAVRELMLDTKAFLREGD